jgi:hypothetical protein
MDEKESLLKNNAVSSSVHLAFGKLDNKQGTAAFIHDKRTFIMKKIGLGLIGSALFAFIAISSVQASENEGYEDHDRYEYGNRYYGTNGYTNYDYNNQYRNRERYEHSNNRYNNYNPYNGTYGSVYNNGYNYNNASNTYGYNNNYRHNERYEYNR